MVLNPISIFELISFDVRVFLAIFAIVSKDTALLRVFVIVSKDTALFMVGLLIGSKGEIMLLNNSLDISALRMPGKSSTSKLIVDFASDLHSTW